MGCYNCGSERGTETRLCPRCAQKRLEERRNVRTRVGPTSKRNSPLMVALTIIIGFMVGASGVLIYNIYEAKKKVENEFETAFAGMMQEMEKEMEKGLNEAISKSTVTGAAETEVKDDELNAEQYELPEGWVEEDVDEKDPKIAGYFHLIMSGKGSAKYVNPTQQNKKYKDYLLYLDSEGNELKKEKVEYVLKPGKKITKQIEFSGGVEHLKHEEVFKHDSRVFRDGWEDTLYKEELIEKQPETPKFSFIPSSSSGNPENCFIWIANTESPKRINIEIKRLDKFPDGKVLKTENYTYDLDYNHQITRNFPRIKGEKFCRVDTKIIQ